ncbi:MAG TPA: beta-phosphoglucomutase family hydrolase [Pyrinomonadaceae bacterium]|nr:beta-phosphoglucomutase family hydrolase [Pyrinomonadaceae bacterium]
MTEFSRRAFIFDMDGTLVDNMHVHTEAWGTLLAENGIEMDRHKFLVATAGKTNREILPTVFGDISAERADELARRKESLYREAYLPVRKPVEGLVEFLTEAKGLGIRMAVATASAIPNMEFILDGLDLRRFFDTVTTATDVKVGKPDPAMFLVSAEKLGVEPENCIVFEDAFGGFEAAHRANMVSIGIATVNSIEDILKCDSVVEAHLDFSELRPQDLIAKYVPI